MVRPLPVRLALLSALAVALAPVAAHADGGGTPVRRTPAAQAPAITETRLALDTARPLRLAAPASGVVVGNPSIVGVSVQNERLLFLTGRAYGTTNLIVVDPDGRVIYQTRVTVVPDEGNAVVVLRGAESTRLECTPLCRPRPDIGDDSETFGQANAQASARSGAAQSGAAR